MQKEFKEMLDAINKWAVVNNGRVAFMGTFISVDEDKVRKGDHNINLIKDSVNLGFGFRELLEVSLKGLQELLEKNKKNIFVSYLGKVNITIENYKDFDITEILNKNTIILDESKRDVEILKELDKKPDA